MASCPAIALGGSALLFLVVRVCHQSSYTKHSCSQDSVDIKTETLAPFLSDSLLVLVFVYVWHFQS